MASPLGIFPAIISQFIKGWSGLTLSLTCRQSVFVEDIQKKELGRKRQEQVDKQMPPFASAYKNTGRPHPIKRTSRGDA